MLKQSASAKIMNLKRAWQLVAVVLLPACSIVAFTAGKRAWIVRATEVGHAAASATATHAPQVTPQSSLPGQARQAAPQNAVRSPVQVARFTIYDVGLYPRELHVSRGMIRISIEDLSGGTPGIEVERETGNGQRVSAGQVRRAGPSQRGQSDLQLEPGRYFVFDTRNPNGKAELIVEP